jgi:hypothetical protein
MPPCRSADTGERIVLAMYKTMGTGAWRIIMRVRWKGWRWGVEEGGEVGFERWMGHIQVA